MARFTLGTLGKSREMGLPAEELDTAIAQWNQEHPEAELLAGLAIMGVNGRRKGEEHPMGDVNLMPWMTRGTF